MKIKGFNGTSFDSLLLTFVKIVTMIVSIAQTKILSVKLSLQDYGTYSQANIVISIVASLVMLGLADATSYFYNKESETNVEKKVKVVNTILLIELIAGIIGFLFILLGNNLISLYFSNPALKNLLIIAAVKPMFDNILYLYQILFVSIGKAKVIAIRNLIVSLLKLIAIYIVVNVIQNLMAIFAALLLLDFLQWIFFKVTFAKSAFITNPFCSDKSLVKPIIMYGLPMAIFALTTTLNRDVDKLVIGYLADTEILAVYTNCSKVLPFDIISNSFALVLIPFITQYLSQKRYKDATDLFKNYFKIGYYSAWILGFAAIIVSRQLIPFLYSDEYLWGEGIFIVYVLDSMLKFASMHLILTSSGNAKQLMIYSLISLGSNAVLNIILFSLLSTIGPAISTLIVTLCYTLLVLFKSLNVLNAKVKDVFDIKEIFAFVCILLLTGTVFYMMNKWLISPNINETLSMIVIVGAFCATNFLVNFRKIKKAIVSINQLRLGA